MHIALIADTFPPLRTSGAVQLRDLAKEFHRQGHQVTVLLPSSDLDRPWTLESLDGVQVLRLKAPRTKDINYVLRTIGELLMPFFMQFNLRKSPLALQKWDGVVWYSPSIFHGPLINRLRKINSCKSYLIIRDIFPDWAVDMGLMGKGLPYFFFSAVARYQYSVANTIGVQTKGNKPYFEKWERSPERKLEVLQNWLSPPVHRSCKIRIEETSLRGRKIFVYAGNMGVAQGMDVLLELAKQFKNRDDVGFLFVGRGSDTRRLVQLTQNQDLNNVLFFDEIHPDEIPDLFSQCSIGLLSLDPRHTTHNIPGKFLAYMQNGLPVLANVNAGNDIINVINTERVGRVCHSKRFDHLVALAEELVNQIDSDKDLSKRCKSLYEREYSAARAAKQIVFALSN